MRSFRCYLKMARRSGENTNTKKLEDDCDLMVVSILNIIHCVLTKTARMYAYANRVQQ